MCSADIFLGLIAILFPPLAVWVKCGICSADSLINILLCCLGYIPGLLHAWYIIAKFPEPPYEYESLPQDREEGRVTYVFVQGQDGSGRRQQQPKPQAPHSGMNYGTQGNNSAGQQQGVSSSSRGPSDDRGGVPPSYAEVVGDHKVQTQD